MAGHSQFKNIMHRKGAQDIKRAKIFTKIAKEINVAVKTGGGSDPAMNAKLRSALISARSVNMPKDNIEKAIKRASGDSEGLNFESIIYEGYGPYGVAIIVEALTDNKNRSASDIRAIFNKYNGNMGSSGSVSFLFEHIGIIKLESCNVDFDKLFEFSLKEGAIDTTVEDDIFVVKTEIEDLHRINNNLINIMNIQPLLSKIEWIPKTEVHLNEDQAIKLIKMIEVLEESDDVQNVFSNFSTSLEVLQKINK